MSRPFARRSLRAAPLLPAAVAMLLAARLATQAAQAAEATATAAGPLPTAIVLTLKGHRFTPDRVSVPAGQRIRVQVVNQDATADEFESEDLQVEKDIDPHGRLTFQVGPLAPGEYLFKGDLHADTATGVIVAVKP